jgi:TolB-like protein/Tfp pilus assembly protein PilF
MTDSNRGYQHFFAEMKRRRVFRMMAAYGATAFVLLQVADLLAEGMGLSDQVLRITTFLVLVGFPIAIVLAWAFESTPKGMRRTTDAAPGELDAIISAPASQRLPAGLMGLVGVAALVMGAWWVGRQSAPTGGSVEASIAVLPFADMSPNADQGYFSDGISEELLNLLARIPDLHVAARTSSFSFKDQDLEITEIADRLNVAYVLEGSVRKAENDVRITAQLIRADDGFHMWSRTWDRTLENIFAIQDEIAADVTEQLKVTLLGEAPTVQKTDPAAYTLFLQARQLDRQRTPEGVAQSNALHKRALEIDSDYVAAWAGLASNYRYQAEFALVPPDEGFRLAREAANRALAIDPDYALAYATLGRVASIHDGDLEAGARHFEHALALDASDTDMLHEAAHMAADLGRISLAIALNEYVVAHDPVNPRAHAGLAYTYLDARRWDEAIAELRTTLSLSPGRIFGNYAIGLALLQKGEPEAALAAVQQESFETFRLCGLALAYHALGQMAESDGALTELIDKYGQDWAFEIAYVLASRGEADRAFEWLDKAAQRNDAGLLYILRQSQFANIHDDPRWLPFLESIGKLPEQLAAIEFDVRLPR